jgi:beta-ribofuranosylaminobenzene 5'-phosphate synthase
MPEATVQVSAASRLHFGMVSFGAAGVPQFGGVGAMIDHGALQLRIRQAEQFVVSGPLAERVQAAVPPIAKSLGFNEAPECEIKIVTAPSEHLGLGTGTQLHLSLAAGLVAWQGRSCPSREELVVAAGRAARSSVGSHGFFTGGLLIDSGKIAEEPLGELTNRRELPSAWRFGLVCPPGERGLSGADEQQAFSALPPVPRKTTEQLWAIVFEQLVPALDANDFVAFSDSLTQFNFACGLCFAARQGGAFASSLVADTVAALRGLGVRGVGQSSWGPTVFALFEHEDAAQRLQKEFQSECPWAGPVRIVKPCNTSAEITNTV